MEYVKKVLKYFLNFEDNYNEGKKKTSQILHVFFLSMTVAFPFFVNESDFNKVRLPLAFFMLSFFMSLLFKKEFDIKNIFMDNILDILGVFLGITIVMIFGDRLSYNEIRSSLSSVIYASGYIISFSLFSALILYKLKLKYRRIIIFTATLSIMISIPIIFLYGNINSIIITMIQVIPIFIMNGYLECVYKN